MGHDVTVIGSANLDVVVPVEAVPSPGETVLATGPATRHAGGKGLNQAVACARAGASTRFVGAVGDDAAAEVLLGALTEAGVGTDAVARRAGRESGVAHVLVRPDGENAIVVVPGANAGWVDLDAAAQRTVGEARVLLAQLEVDPGAVGHAAGLAREAGVTVVLNAAPASATAVGGLLDLVDVLVVNQHEAGTLTGEERVEDAVAALASGTRDVVVTLGADGALLLTRDGALSRVRAPRVRAVDTTGAGDAFVGALAAALAAGVPLPVALRRACVAGSLAVQVHGAVPSLPTADAVDEVLARTP